MQRSKDLLTVQRSKVSHESKANALNFANIFTPIFKKCKRFNVKYN